MSSAWDQLVPLASVLRDVVAPPVCLGCRAPGRDLCGACRRALAWLDGCCPRCALPAPCGRRCPGAGRAWDLAWSAVAFAGPARELVLALKHRHARVAAGVMGAGLARAPLASGSVLVALPTHCSRRRARGFDQSVLLVDALAGRTGLDVFGGLERVGAAAQQVGAGRAERLEEGRLALRVRGGAPERCVLVDDVHTTGASLHAGAAALKAAGARHVTAISYARALR